MTLVNSKPGCQGEPNDMPSQGGFRLTKEDLLATEVDLSVHGPGRQVPNRFLFCVYMGPHAHVTCRYGDEIWY